MIYNLMYVCVYDYVWRKRERKEIVKKKNNKQKLGQLVVNQNTVITFSNCEQF